MNLLFTLSVCLLALVWPGFLFAQTNRLTASLTNVPDSVKLWTLRHVGDSLVNAGQFMLARHAYRQALTMAQTDDDLDAIGLGYRGMGYWHESTGDYGQAIGWYQQALTTSKQSGDQRKFARTLAFVGFCYDRLNKSKEARRHRLHGLGMARDGGYETEFIQLSENLANVEAHAKHYERALPYTQNVLTLEVHDNGPGIETAEWQPNHRSSFGKRLIASLSDQLNGRFEWLKQNGTLFRLSMPTPRLVGP